MASLIGVACNFLLCYDGYTTGLELLEYLHLNWSELKI